MGKKSKSSMSDLGRRERQIMDVIHRLKEAGVGDVRGEMPDPPSYSSVRTMIRLLESKGFLTHRRDGVRYVYRPTQPIAQARRSAIQHLLTTFFNDSTSDAVAALLEDSPEQLSEEQYDRLSEMIEDTKRKGR